MQNIIVGRYGPNEGHLMPDGSLVREWDGWIEPDDLSWIMFVRVDGSPVVFLHRDPRTGGILDPATGSTFNYPDVPVTPPT